MGSLGASRGYPVHGLDPVMMTPHWPCLHNERQSPGFPWTAVPPEIPQRLRSVSPAKPENRDAMTKVKGHAEQEISPGEHLWKPCCSSGVTDASARKHRIRKVLSEEEVQQSPSSPPPPLLPSHRRNLPPSILRPQPSSGLNSPPATGRKIDAATGVQDICRLTLSAFWVRSSSSGLRPYSSSVQWTRVSSSWRVWASWRRYLRLGWYTSWQEQHQN